MSLSDNTGNVLKFEPVEVGDHYRADPDEILENAKGAGFSNLLVIGQYEDGTLYVSGASNTGVALVLMELAKFQLIHGDD